jgi:hypothetical protein
VAFQQQLGNTMAVGLRGIYRHWNDLIDDRKVFEAATGNVITEPMNFSSDVLKRYYRAVEVTFDKRFSRNWQSSINYTLSRAEGNQFNDYTSQLFDFANENCRHRNLAGAQVTEPCPLVTDINRYGLASYDRTHSVKAFTAYTLPLSWVAITAAPSFFWQSGLPYQEQRSTSSLHGYTFTYFFEKRGSRRLPSYYRLDFALEGVFKPWGPLEVGVKGEVFNLTNQQPIIDNTRLTLIPGSSFGFPTSRNSFQAPRNYRLTALLRF